MNATDRILQHLGQLEADPESDRLLHGLAAGHAAPLERLVEVAYGTDTLAAEDTLQDPARCSPWAVPHAALYTGGRMPRRLPGESDAAYTARARAVVISAVGMLAGGPSSVRAAAQQFLEGTRMVTVVQRYNGDEWEILVVTRTKETPYPAAVERAINDPDVIKAGVHATLLVIGGQSWAEAAAVDNRTWAELLADEPDATWQQAEDDDIEVP